MNPAPVQNSVAHRAAVGRHVLSELHATGAADVRVLVRPGSTAHRPDGVDVATASLDDATGRAAALTGVRTVFLVWPFLTTERAPDVLEAIGQHAQRLVYLSSIGVGGPEEQVDPSSHCTLTWNA